MKRLDHWTLTLLGCALLTLKAHAQDMPLSMLLLDGEGWQLVSEGHAFTDGPCADDKGNFYFSDLRAMPPTVWKVAPDGAKSKFLEGTSCSGLKFGPDGRLYACANADKQVVVFDLPGGKKTKTGAWSTDADILEELAAQGHELPRAILDWRQLSKLKSTYTDALPTYVNPRTARVHTSYALGYTTTGRLSSNEPNLQNIPIRTGEGREGGGFPLLDLGGRDTDAHEARERFLACPLQRLGAAAGQLAPRARERLVAPRIPIHGIARVLQQVGTLLACESGRGVGGVHDG